MIVAGDGIVSLFAMTTILYYKPECAK